VVRLTPGHHLRSVEIRPKCFLLTAADVSILVHRGKSRYYTAGAATRPFCRTLPLAQSTQEADCRHPTSPKATKINEEKAMISTFRFARVIVLASLALSSTAWGATCSNASLSGTYGFLHDGTDSSGTPATAAVSQIAFDSTTGTFTGETTASHDGVIAPESLTGTYTVASDCTGTGTPTAGSPFSIVVTSTGFLAVHPFSEGFAVKQGSPTCTNAAATGSFGFETTGVFLAGAPATGWVAFIGELKLTVNPSGEGVIIGHVAGSEGDTTLTFAPVTGSFAVDKDCRGRATISPQGRSEMRFTFLVVDSGKKMLAIETDADTIVSGTMVKGNEEKAAVDTANVQDTTLSVSAVSD
jgi:hypothetical protein